MPPKKEVKGVIQGTNYGGATITNEEAAELRTQRAAL